MTEQESTSAYDAGGPAWDIGCEYPSFDDPSFQADLTLVTEGVGSLSEVAGDIAACIPGCENLDPKAERDLLARCVEAFERLDKVSTVFSNLAVYVSCALSIDGADPVARRLSAEMDRIGAELGRAADPLELFTTLCSEDFLSALLARQSVTPYGFKISRKRLRRSRLLSLEEEGILKAVGVDGFTAWGSLYKSISSTTPCSVKSPEGEREMGIAQASGLLRHGERTTREAAWRAINDAYARHDESLCSILNAIAGWRLSENKLRSKFESVEFLDSPLDQNNMSLPTLEAMMGAVDEASEIGRRALRAQAKAFGIASLAPWDLQAPAPKDRAGKEGANIRFDRGLEMVREAFAAINEEMGTFIDTMRERNWIEGRSLKTKRPGAYCTGFEKSRTPRVYMTFLGSLDDVGTLAHELGHAYHGWVMRELPRVETEYPMTLAETASTFAEAVLGDYLMEKADDEREKFSLAWSKAQDAATFLLNIPARYEFEKAFYRLRSERTVQASELSDLMKSAWKKYYGDSLSEYDGSFWKSKLHFYKTGISFYNFPYTFGYLFSMGVYAQRSIKGAGFFEAYTSMLMDTGRMTVEELASRHLGVDVTKRDFWKAGIDLVDANVTEFERLI